LFDVEKLRGQDFTVDFCLPVVRPFFPKRPFFFVSLPFSYNNQVVKACNFPGELKLIQFFLLFAEGKSTQFYFYFPVFHIKELVHKGELSIYIRCIVAIKDLAVLFSIICQPFGRTVNLQLSKFVWLNTRGPFTLFHFNAVANKCKKPQWKTE